jgi:hypothetical protein
MFNLHSLRDDLIPIRKTTDRAIWWRYQITKNKTQTFSRIQTLFCEEDNVKFDQQSLILSYNKGKEKGILLGNMLIFVAKWAIWKQSFSFRELSVRIRDFSTIYENCFFLRQD